MPNLSSLLDKYDQLPLECDGLVRVLHWVLTKKNISHTVAYGMLYNKHLTVSIPHYWIKLPTGEIIDYRARMWVGKEAPHGIFMPSSQNVVNYTLYEESFALANLNEMVIRVLGVNPDTLEILV